MEEAARDLHARYLATARFPSLDGLRCLAIAPVVWHHATLGPLPGALGKGPIGVDLFFALSGFLITTLLLRERDGAGSIDPRAFYRRRALRIFPLYYAVLALYAVYAYAVMADGAQRAHFFSSLPFFASYTTNWFVDFAVPHPVSFAFSWSLATEEQFYLVWPWVFLLAVGRRARWVAPVVLALSMLALTEGVAHGEWQGLLPLAGLARRIAGSISSPICLGALLALALHSARGFRLLGAVLGRRVSSLLAFALVALCMVRDDVPLFWTRVTLTLFVGACALDPRHALAWFTDARPVRWVGTVSYGIYLFHVPVITLARRVLPVTLGTPGWVFCMVFPVTTALASASYVWFERPLLRRRCAGGIGRVPRIDADVVGPRRAGEGWVGLAAEAVERA